MRFPQAILIDPRKVLPSRHSIFIRGFPGNVSIDDIKELFSKQCDGKCKIDFFSFSEDKSQLFVAIRFDSHSVAKRLISKYDGERIFGYKVELNWFKDIRKARKKVIENEYKYQTLLAHPHFDVRRRPNGRFPLRRMGLKRFGGKFLQRHYEAPPTRQCVSSSDSSGSRSRSSSFSRQSRSPHRRGSSSSDSSRSPPRPLPVRRRSPVKSSHSDSGSCSSSSSSSPASCRSAVNGRKEQPAPPATQLVYEYDEVSGEKEVLEAACKSLTLTERSHLSRVSYPQNARQIMKACSPPNRKNVSASHSDSADSRRSSTHTSRRSTRGDEEHDHQVQQELRKEPQKEQQQPQNMVIPYTESSEDEQSPKRKREKRKKRTRHRKNKRSKRVRSLGTPVGLESVDLAVPANGPNAVDPENAPADVVTPVKKPMDDEEIHEILEVEQLSLNNIFLPDEAPEPLMEEKLDASGPLPTSPPATNPDESDRAETTEEVSVTQVEDQSSAEQIDAGTQTTFEPGFSKSTSTDFGTQASVPTKGSSAISGTDEILSQISTLTDARIDEIFQQKRLIEAAYRLDCEGYTASVGKLVRPLLQHHDAQRNNPMYQDKFIKRIRFVTGNYEDICIPPLTYRYTQPGLAGPFACLITYATGRSRKAKYQRTAGVYS
ncbi:hypothetical protein X801_04618 [Opisthorchis viverrini]|uniref:RRM domain-containing protein n=1 Tax=Opisthorchis viverrini TaxID=6198 RepID=A0A1S8WZ46_OPIVI|nr:hypothetical protein X801_04618 [Opisthorchis viverrini]